MLITNKQLKEIEFLEKYFDIDSSTKEQREEYIYHTVRGIKGKNPIYDKNLLFQAKRKLDINIKMWRKDLTIGLISVEELKEDFNCEYGHNLIDSIIKSVDKKYREKMFKKYSKIVTILSFTNFPEIMNYLQKIYVLNIRIVKKENIDKLIPILIY